MLSVIYFCIFDISYSNLPIISVLLSLIYSAASESLTFIKLKLFVISSNLAYSFAYITVGGSNFFLRI